MLVAAVSLDLCVLSFLQGRSSRPIGLLCAAISVASVLVMGRIFFRLDSFLRKPRPLPRIARLTVLTAICGFFGWMTFRAAFLSGSSVRIWILLFFDLFFAFTFLKRLMGGQN